MRIKHLKVLNVSSFQLTGNILFPLQAKTLILENKSSFFSQSSDTRQYTCAPSARFEWIVCAECCALICNPANNPYHTGLFQLVLCLSIQKAIPTYWQKYLFTADSMKGWTNRKNIITIKYILEAGSVDITTKVWSRGTCFCLITRSICTVRNC